MAQWIKQFGNKSESCKWIQLKFCTYFEEGTSSLIIKSSSKILPKKKKNRQEINNF